MNPVSRGVRNAFRNGVRTTSIVVILGLSIGLALTMLVAQKAVENKIASVKSSIGNTITVSPAGFNPGSQANNALTTSGLSKIKSLAHVSGITETLTDRQSTTGSSMPSFGRFGGSNSDTSQTTTSLTSPVTLNAGGGNGGGRFFISGGGAGDESATSFSLPISFLGTTDPSHVNDTVVAIKSGKTIDGSLDANDALVSQAMADKNNLAVGSTFTAYNTTLTVAGIFTTTAANQGTDNTVLVSLPSLQRLSGQSDVVTGTVVTVDSLDNLSSVTSKVSSLLGSSADVTSAQEQADNTVKPLNNVKTVTTYSLIGAIVAGAVIILLVMIMIVRERKKEIGVAKAIGGSNARIMGEFMVEALTLAVMGALIGLLIGVIGGQPVTKQLVNSSTNSSAGVTAVTGPGGRSFNIQRSGNNTGEAPVARGGFRAGFRRNGAVQSFSTIKAEIGPSILLEGLGAAVLIAIIGSCLAAGMISRIRPSTILRAE